MSGCAQERLRQQSQAALAAGQPATAIRLLEAGVREHPDSALLRSGLVQARLEALTQALAAAGALRAQGQLEAARQQLEQALALAPGDTRVLALLDELAADRRQAEALARAQQLAEREPPEAARRLVDEALKENPRHPGLLALQRRLEMAARHAALHDAAGRLEETRPISLDFRDASLRTVLDVVSRSSGINFVFDRDVRPDGRITVLMRNARVEDVLDLVTSSQQLAKKVVDRQTIVIYPNTPEKRREYEEQVVRVFHLASADAKGAAAFLRAMLNIKEPFVDERSNMLSLRESKENVVLAERLLALYDAGEPEVLLELEVLEISASRLTELGIKFPDTFSLTPLAPPGSGGLTLGNVRGLDSDRLALGIGGLLVNLKRQVGDFTTLAHPRIRARQREKAKVLVGDKIPVITTTTGTGGFVSDSVSYIEVGLKLDVEPTVYADDEVAIRVALEASTLGSAIRTASGALAYQIGTRNAQTTLRLRDGETQLLAGLISREDRTNASRVPGLGDLPVLGRLFSSQLDNGQRTELVLAITPRVLRNVRRPTISEAELWVGTDASPQLRRPPAARLGPAGGEGAAAGAAVSPASSASSAAPAPAAAPAGRLALHPQAPAEVAAGDAFELPLVLTSDAPPTGLMLGVAFDRQRLHWLAPRLGDRFTGDGVETRMSHAPASGAEPARIDIRREAAAGGPAAAGSGPAVVLRFRALAAGPTAIRIDTPRAIVPGQPALDLPPVAPVEVTIR